MRWGGTPAPMGAPAHNSSAPVPRFLLLQLGRKHQPCLPHRFSARLRPLDEYSPNPTVGKLAWRRGAAPPPSILGQLQNSPQKNEGSEFCPEPHQPPADLPALNNSLAGSCWLSGGLPSLPQSLFQVCAALITSSTYISSGKLSPPASFHFFLRWGEVPRPGCALGTCPCHLQFCWPAGTQGFAFHVLLVFLNEDQAGRSP